MSDLASLTKYLAEYEPGTVLFHEGDEANQMFVIHSGSVEIRRHIGDRDRTLAILPAGEFFGEMALVNDRPRSATAVIHERSRLLVIDSDTFESMLQSKPEIAVRIISTLAARLERANQQIELLLLRDANHRVVQCLRQLSEERAQEELGCGAVYLPVAVEQLSERVALPVDEVQEILNRLSAAQLVVRAQDAGTADDGSDDDGFVVPEVGRLLEFLEFLELTERQARNAKIDK